MGWMGLSAQGISVTSFKPLPDDLTANLAGTQVKDQNGEVAALIKVVTTQTGFTFEGGMAGIVKTKQEVGEIWVYVPHGIQKITIKHPQLGVLRNYYFPCAIDEARTYEMVLAAGEVRTVVTQDAGGSFLALTVEPKSASVYIDGELQVSDGSGDYIKALPYGEHQYRIEAGSYMTEAGVVTIGKEKQTLNIKLQSALATLTVNSTTPGTKIYVNEQLRGTDRWSGSVPAGMYIIEGRLDGHRSQKMSVTLGKQEQKAATLPALEPIVGSLEVSYKPIGAEVWLDGKQLGTSPDVFRNILVGTHSLLIKKDGCAEHRETITITEGEKKVVTGALNTTLYSDFSGKLPAKGTDAYGYYEKAITGDAAAQASLGYEYDKQKDYASAVYWYRKAAEQGYAYAQYNLGDFFYTGNGVTKDYDEAVKWWRKAAEQGYAPAQYNLGYCYYNGNGVTKDYAEAVKCYQKAAEQGFANAQCNLGVCYDKGTGVTQDYAEAVKWYRKAAEQGYAPAQFNLGKCYDKGNGVTKDYAEAVKWWRKAAEQGFANAQYNLGNCYYNGDGVTKDYAEAVKWYRKAAEQGFANAQFSIGYCYAQGNGVTQDYAEAVKWYRKAAEQGYAPAQFNLGLCYDQGNGVTEDSAEAVKWYRKAADQGFAYAQCNIGLCYFYGDGVTKSITEAVKWYRKAAEQGFAPAQGNLGDCYYYGNGVTKDYAEAMKWYRKAAEQGFADAQNSLGFCYFYGDGVTKSITEAVKWFRKAAEQGLASAQYFLGNCYENGQGVTKSITEAVKWYRQAADQGFADAKYSLKRLGYSE